MTNRTYRSLDAPLRIAGFTARQWLWLVTGGGAVVAVLYVSRLPTKPALSIGALLLGPPIALAYLSDEIGWDVSQLLRDAMLWVVAPRRLRPGAGAASPTLLVASKDTTRRRRRGRPQAAGDVLPIASGPTADGLVVLADGAFVRWLEVQPLNPLVLDADALGAVARGFAQVAARIPPLQTLQLYVQATSLPVESISETQRREADAAARNAAIGGGEDLARAMRWLNAAQEQSLRSASDALAACALRHIVVSTWRPRSTALTSRRRQVRWLAPPEAARLTRASEQIARGVIQELEAMDLRVRLLAGDDVCDLLWSRFAPGRSDRDERPPSAMTRDLVGALDDARDEEESGALGAHLRDMLAPEAIDLSRPTHLAVGEQVEQTTYLASIPEHTWPGWLLHLMQLPRPFALSVHVRATERHRERSHHRRRYKRIYGLNRGTEGRGRPLDPDAQLGEEEAAALNAELATTAGAGVYDVSVYLTIREPSGDVESLQEQAEEAGREGVAVADVRLAPGRFAQLKLWQSGLPLGVDTARRSRKYVARNVADTLPLVWTGCGSPTGLPIGFAQPGRTLEHLDPFDPEHANHVLLVNGKSGSGKTMTTVVLVARAIAKGARGFVIDRAGHFDYLCRLVPGALSLSIASGAERTAINPWDVDDPATVEPRKIAYLLALHALLIGRHDGGDQELEPLESNLLGLAIRGVYARCAASGEMPRESLLQEELYRRAEDERSEGAAEISLVLRGLAERLHHYVGDGPHAYLVDRETTVPDGAPLVAFDTRFVPDEVSGAALFIICEHVTRRVEARRQAALAGTAAANAWTHRSFLVVDEAWKLVERRATGRWVNELARRSRHLALWLIAVSQQLSDFDNEHGRALLDNASMRLFLRQDAKELAYVRNTLGLTDEAIESIAGLQTAKRSHACAYLMNGTRGQGVVLVRLGAIEYWLATNDPARDEPVRQAAMRQATAELGVRWQASWRALRLLSDPAWHQAQP